jgi:gliding motility-associated-like protein
LKNSYSFLSIVLICFIQFLSAQNISVDQNLYSDQQLVEDVLFGTNCVDNISVNNTVSGNFSNGELSYGYFNANNSDFPFSEGLVLTTGRLSNVPGPNNSLSDDDAPNWIGDQDLEDALGINNTLNATIFEFSFVPQATTINFRYLFASEEYRENQATTCQFSDAFAFLIRPVGGQYDNLALIPGTDIPVQVTTVRPEIPDACDALNEEYFGQFNDTFSPINFNGQTTILTAETDVVAGQAYEIKLVIADETNYRFDSAVFIEANSFNVGVDLGQNQTLCAGETTTLQVDNEQAIAIRWFFEGQQINSGTSNLLVSQQVSGSGLYSVEVDLPSGCTAEDEVNIFFDDVNLPDDLSVSSCIDEDGFGVFNLFDVSGQIDPNLQVLNFFNSLENAELDTEPIANPGSYNNVIEDEVVFARILSPGNCIVIQEVFLVGQTLDLPQVITTVCPALETSPTSFSLQAIINQISDVLSVGSGIVDLYASENDAINQDNEITSGFLEIETDLLPVTVYARINSDSSCGIAPVLLQKIDAPLFTDNQTDFLICENEGNTINLNASIENPQGEIFYDWSTGETTEQITISEPGNYSVDVTSIQMIGGEEIICTNFKNFSVVASSAPIVSYTQTGFVGVDNQLIITAEGSGDYEYALNDSVYVDSNTFNVVETENTLFVRDKNGCGEISIDFVALRIPDFFTPNADGFNDYWQIEGIRQNENDISTIYIFDRYGKLIFESSPQLIGWDGTYKGIPMPQQDYWYKIQLSSGRSITGHLTLKR